MSNILSPSFRKEIVEGKNKVIYQSDTKGVLLAYFKEDDMPIAEIRAGLSANIFSILTFCGIKNHFLCLNGVVEHKIMALDMLPFRFVVYSVVNEDLSKKIFLKPGLRLDKYLVEVYLKGEGQDVLLSRDHLSSLAILSCEMVDAVFVECRRIMDIIYAFFQGMGINVFSLSLSFGKQYKNNGEDFDIVLGDEMSLKNINLSLNAIRSSEKSITKIQEAYLKIASKLEIKYSDF